MTAPPERNAPAGTEARRKKTTANINHKTTPRRSQVNTGRQRFVRLFPERLDFLLSRLSPVELTAYLRVLAEYCVRDGDMDDDDRQLARIAKLSRASWAALRETLLDLGVSRVADGKWIEDDQQVNLDKQRAAAERQRARAMRRWHPTVVK